MYVSYLRRSIFQTGAVSNFSFRMVNWKTRKWNCLELAVCFALLLCIGRPVSAQIRYTVPEGVKRGSVVGNIAKDLGLDTGSLVERRFRIVSGSEEPLFEANQNNGVLYVHRNIDREELCDESGACLTNLKIVVENPLEIHYVDVEITDVNDHSPKFRETEQHFDIAEHYLPGALMVLEACNVEDHRGYRKEK